MITAGIAALELQALSEDSENFVDKATKKLRRKTRKDFIRLADVWNKKPKLDQVYNNLWPKLLKAENETKEWEQLVDNRRQSAIKLGASVSSKIEAEIATHESRLNELEDLANDCLQLQFDVSKEMADQGIALTFHCEVMLQNFKSLPVPVPAEKAVTLPPHWGVSSSPKSSKKACSSSSTPDNESVAGQQPQDSPKADGKSGDSGKGVKATNITPKSLLSELLLSAESDAAISSTPLIVSEAGTGTTDYSRIRNMQHESIVVKDIADSSRATELGTAAKTTSKPLSPEPVVSLAKVIPSNLQLSPSSNDFYPNDCPAIWHNVSLSGTGISPTKSPIGIQKMKAFLEDGSTEVSMMLVSSSPPRPVARKAVSPITCTCINNSSPPQPGSAAAVVSGSSSTMNLSLDIPHSVDNSSDSGSPVFALFSPSSSPELVISPPSLSPKSGRNPTSISPTFSDDEPASPIADSKTSKVVSTALPVANDSTVNLVDTEIEVDVIMADSKPFISTKAPTAMIVDTDIVRNGANNNGDDDKWSDSNEKRKMLTSKSLDLRHVNIPRTQSPMGNESPSKSPQPIVNNGRVSSPAAIGSRHSNNNNSIKSLSIDPTTFYSTRELGSTGGTRKRSHSQTSHLDNQVTFAENIIQSILSNFPDNYLKMLTKESLYVELSNRIYQLQAVKDSMIPIQKAIAANRESTAALKQKLKHQRSELQRLYHMMTVGCNEDIVTDVYGNIQTGFKREQSMNSSGGSADNLPTKQPSKTKSFRTMASKFMSVFGNSSSSRSVGAVGGVGEGSRDDHEYSSGKNSPLISKSSSHRPLSKHISPPNNTMAKSPSGGSLNGFDNNASAAWNSSMLRTLSGNQVLPVNIISTSDDYFPGLSEMSDSGDSRGSNEALTGLATKECIDEIRLVLEQESKLTEQKSIISTLVSNVAAAQKQLLDSKDTAIGKSSSAT